MKWYEQTDIQRKSLRKYFLGICFHFCECGVFHGSETISGVLPDGSSPGSRDHLLSGGHLLFPTEQSETSGTWRDLAALCKPSEQTPNHREKKKEGEIKRRLTDVALQINANNPGARTGTKKKKAQGSRCGEEGTPGGKLLPRVGTERNNSSPHERCRRCVHCVWAKTVAVDV